MLSKSAHSGIGQFRISVLILRQFEFAPKVPVEGLRATWMGQERQMMQMQNCPIAVWFDLVEHYSRTRERFPLFPPQTAPTHPFGLRLPAGEHTPVWSSARLFSRQSFVAFFPEF
jgi:hypothetical protein